MGGLGEEDGDIEAAGEDSEACYVIDVLVGDEDGVESIGVFAHDGHAAEKFAAGETGIDEDSGAGAGDDGAIAFGTRG